MQPLILDLFSFFFKYLSKIMRKIFSFLREQFKKPFIKNILIIALLFCLWGLGYTLISLSVSHNKLKQQFENNKQEIVYYSDSVKTYKDANDRLVYEKQLIEHDSEILQNNYTDLLTEYKLLEKENSKNKSKSLIVSKADIEINKKKFDTESDISVVNDSVYHIHFKDNSTDLLARMFLKPIVSFKLDSLRYKTDLIYSIIEDNSGNLSIKVRSNDPDIEIENIQGSLFNIKDSKFIEKELNRRVNILEKKNKLEDQKRFSVGIHAGYGVMLQSVNSDNRGIVYGPYVGLGISYNLFRF